MCLSQTCSCGKTGVSHERRLDKALGESLGILVWRKKLGTWQFDNLDTFIDSAPRTCSAHVTCRQRRPGLDNDFNRWADTVDARIRDQDLHKAPPHWQRSPRNPSIGMQMDLDCYFEAGLLVDVADVVDSHLEAWDALERVDVDRTTCCFVRNGAPRTPLLVVWESFGNGSTSLCLSNGVLSPSGKIEKTKIWRRIYGYLERHESWKERNVQVD